MIGGLGRRPFPDARDQAFLMRMALPIVMPKRPKRKVWPLWWKGNQGNTSQCVGYCLHAVNRAKPYLQREPKPGYIYTEAQKNDEWKDEPHEGTSVRAGAEVLLREGKIVDYRWAKTLEDVLNWLAFEGPVGLGTRWDASMDTTDSTGLIVPGGRERGGHAYADLGYDDEEEILICQQSWPLPWGLNGRGRFHLRYRDFETLLNDGGEACAIRETVTI